MEPHVLICGESGAGKGSLAEGMRRDGLPLVVVDCRALPATVVEVALKGYARSNCFSRSGPTIRRGAFEQAGDGTIVLDEVAALPRELHHSIAGVLARRTVRRVGENRGCAMPARVVATTADRDALEPILREQFVIRELAPLRDRLGEVAPALPRAAIARLAKLQLDLDTVLRVARAGDLDAAIDELELLASIVAADADDDGPRRVYADVLLARDDVRGELIHVQCELARRPGSRRLRAHERRLLGAYGGWWLAPVLAIPHVTSAVLRRGFIELVRGTADVERVRDLLRRVAPVARVEVV